MECYSSDSKEEEKFFYQEKGSTIKISQSVKNNKSKEKKKELIKKEKIKDIGSVRLSYFNYIRM